MKLWRIRRSLYWWARFIGDVQSLRSPQKFIKRQVRKFVYRRLYRLTRKAGL